MNRYQNSYLKLDNILLSVVDTSGVKTVVRGDLEFSDWILRVLIRDADGNPVEFLSKDFSKQEEDWNIETYNGKPEWILPQIFSNILKNQHKVHPVREYIEMVEYNLAYYLEHQQEAKGTPD